MQQRDSNPFATGALGALMLGVDSTGAYKPLAATAPAATFVFGQKAVATAGTELPISATSKPLGVGVWVRAHGGNTGLIYVGMNPVTNLTGFVLAQGESVFIPVSNANLVYVDCATNGDGVSYIGY